MALIIEKKIKIPNKTRFWFKKIISTIQIKQDFIKDKKLIRITPEVYFWLRKLSIVLESIIKNNVSFSNVLELLQLLWTNKDKEDMKNIITEKIVQLAIKGSATNIQYLQNYKKEQINLIFEILGPFKVERWILKNYRDEMGQINSPKIYKNISKLYKNGGLNAEAFHNLKELSEIWIDNGNMDGNSYNLMEKCITNYDLANKLIFSMISEQCSIFKKELEN